MIPVSSGRGYDIVDLILNAERAVASINEYAN
jgi:hypothetical protein